MDKQINLHTGHRERMRTKIMDNNACSLHNHELIEVFLFYSQPRKNTNPIAHNLINRFGTIKNIFDADPQDLLLVDGVSEMTVTLIKSFKELFARYNAIVNVPRMRINNTSSLRCYFETIIKDSTKEELYLAYIDESNSAYSCDCVSIGDSASVETRINEIYSYIRYKQPQKIALAHNHPDTSCYPSQEDVISTLKLKIFLKLMNVELIDHIIFGIDGYCSINSIVEDSYKLFMDSLNDSLQKTNFKLGIQLNRII